MKQTRPNKYQSCSKATEGPHQESKHQGKRQNIFHLLINQPTTPFAFDHHLIMQPRLRIINTPHATHLIFSPVSTRHIHYSRLSNIQFPETECPSPIVLGVDRNQGSTLNSTLQFLLR